MRLLSMLAMLSSVRVFAFATISVALTPATPLVWYEAHGPAQGGGQQLLGVIDSDELAWGNPDTSITLVAGVQGMTVTRMSARMAAGVGAGNINMSCTANGGADVCTCAVSCTASGDTTWSCAGTAGNGCSFSGESTIVFCSKTSNCPTSNPSSKDISIWGVRGSTPEGRDFVPRFIPYGNWGLDAGGSFFGTDSYQFDSITCGWGAPGVVSGGTDVMRVQLIQKSDAGVVCSCDLPGTCADSAGSEHTCSCGGAKYLGSVVEPGLAITKGYAIQWSTSTNCAINPGEVTCAIPFRK